MIQHIHIQGFKSLKDIYVNGTDNIQSFIGKNGSGKSNFFKAIQYFFENLIEENYSEDYYDQNNPFNYEMKIEIRFNLNGLINSNKRVAENKYIGKINKSLTELMEEDSITLILTQTKRKGLIWNLPYKYRYLIHNSHPFYFISTHETDFQKWDFVWEIIGSLGNIFDYEESTSFDKVFSGRAAENFGENINYIEEVFERSGYSLQKESNRSQLSSLYKLALRGSKVNQHGFELKYFSSGTNSLNYLKLMITLVEKLEKEKLKSPIIIIDEPELGLHAQYIDELKELLFSTEGIQFFVSTHSARYLAEAMRNEKSVYKFYFENEYSGLIKIPKLTDSRSRIIFSENEASLYLSSFILFVEGQSELEVFSNPRIRALFPILKKVGVSQTLTNSVLLQSLNPTKMNLPIPFLLVADIDKVLGNKNHQDQEKKETFKVLIKKKEEYSPLNKDYKRNLILNFISNRWLFDIIHKRILSYENNEFQIDVELGTINEQSREQYEKMIQDLKRYYEYFGVYLMFPTLEAALINEKNMQDFISVFSIDISDQEIPERELLFKLRQLVGGNSEDLKNRKLIKSNHSFSKTSGWITVFINAVFDDIEKEKSTKDKRSKFKEKFPDIYGIINKIDKMI
ncbi:retron Eco8 family effector endonuclease [Sporosarcina luteola]|uniref:retron Eco8 family effector endonuclease n=1 Tax=Sporosarcina luteola TaxID=582850 RepID=UPI00203ABE89|nr:retron Eco8 family effector endonuclease [Sporosarcina luteola]